jgi:hypothetical protein
MEVEFIAKLLRERRDQLRLELDLAEHHRRPEIRRDLEAMEQLVERFEANGQEDFFGLPANATAH